MQAALQTQLAQFPATPENGTALYSYLFTNAPEVKKFFKGAENIEPSAIPSDARFQKLGVGFIERLAALVGCCGKEEEFKKAVQEMATKHKSSYGVTVEQFKLMPQLFVDFLKTKGITADPQWHDFWASFLKHAEV